MLTDRTVLVGGLIAVCGVVLSAVILVVALANISIKQEVRLVGIVPSPQIIRLDDTGDAITLSIQGYYSDQSVGDLDDGSGEALSYTSSYPSVVLVDSDGIVTGIELGGADITVTYGSFGATVPVFVRGPVRTVPPVDPERLLEVGDDGSAVVLNRIVVELEPGHNSRDADRVASEIDGEVVSEFRSFPGYIIEFDARTAEGLENALAILEADRRVALAFPDLVLSANNETLRLRLTHPDEVKAYLDAGMEQAWNTMNLVGNSPSELSAVGIAIIDSGFVRQTGDAVVDAVLRAEFDHDKIDYSWWDVFGVIETNSGLATGDHGTTVASVIAARNNTNASPPSFSGVVTSVDGLEYELRMYGVGIVVSGEARPLATAITYSLEDLYQSREQFDVVNISVGHDCGLLRKAICSFPYIGFHSVWARLMRKMPDTTFVFAAGNDAMDANDTLPAKLSLDVPNAITVGATNTHGNQWGSSNFGPSITLGAPGHNVLVVDPKDPDGYGLLDGTSYAAPMVSGTVALLRALDPSLSPQQIKDMIVSAGEPNAIEVCNSRLNPCPLEDQSRWPILNAGTAVNELLSSVDAGIDSQVAQLASARRGSYVELSIPVVNTGDRRWNFHMGGTVFSPNGREIEFEPIQNVVQTNDTHPFKFGFWANEVGEWEIEVAVYRDGEKSIILDSARIGIRVDPPPAVTAVTQTLAAQPATAPVNVQSTPGGMLQADANVLVLADTSGSMDGEKIEQLKSSILEFVGRVDDPGEYIGLIDFDDDIEEVIPLGPFGVSLDPWNHAVEQLDGAGGTAFFDAVSHAMNVLEMQGAPGRVNIIIALTDGVDQDSLRSASDVISELQGASVPVVLFALAYGEDGVSGTDYDLAVLEQLAEATDGVAYAATPEDLERLFTLLATIF